MGKKKRLGFRGLERKVENEYVRKGYSRRTARKWARGTAANVYRRQRG